MVKQERQSTPPASTLAAKRMANITQVDNFSCRIATIAILPASILTNLLLIILIVTKRIANISGMEFFISLSVIDLLYGTALMTSITNVALKRSYQEHVASIEMTAIMHCLILSAVLTQQSHLWLITYERFFAAKYPFRYRVFFKKENRAKMIATAWVVPLIISIAVSLVRFFARISRLVPITMGVGMLATCIAMIYMYWNIIATRRRSLRRVNAIQNAGMEPVNSQQSNQNAEKDLIVSALTVLLTYVVFTAPVLCFLLIADIENTPCQGVYGLGTNITVTIGSLNLLCDPLVYFVLVYRRKKFQTTA